MVFALDWLSIGERPRRWLCDRGSVSFLGGRLMIRAWTDVLARCVNFGSMT